MNYFIMTSERYEPSFFFNSHPLYSRCEGGGDGYCTIVYYMQQASFSSPFISSERERCALFPDGNVIWWNMQSVMFPLVPLYNAPSTSSVRISALFLFCISAIGTCHHQHCKLATLVMSDMQSEAGLRKRLLFTVLM